MLPFLRSREDLDSPNNVFSDIILLGEVEESPDLGSPLGTQSVGDGGVGEAGDVGGAGLGDGNGEDTNVVTNDATSDGLTSASKKVRQAEFADSLELDEDEDGPSTHLPLPLTSTTGSVARVAVGKQKSGSVGDKDTLLHSNESDRSSAYIQP